MNGVNPYHGADFFHFFSTLFSRILLWISGSVGGLVSDEIQLLALVAVGALGSILGIFLVLRRLSMVAGALSHTLLLAVVLTFMGLYFFVGHAELNLLSLPVLLVVSVFCGWLTTSLASWLHRRARLSDDASLALVFSTLFALAIILLSTASKNLHLGLEMIIGNTDAVSVSDLKPLLVSLAAVSLFVTLFFKELKWITFDALHAHGRGVSVARFHHLLMGFVAIALVVTFQVVGVLMSLAFFTGPPLIARLLARRLFTVMVASLLIVFLSALLGVATARHLLTVYTLPLSTAGLIVTWLFVFYMIALLFSPHRGLIVVTLKKKALVRRRQKQQEHVPTTT